MQEEKETITAYIKGGVFWKGDDQIHLVIHDPKVDRPHTTVSRNPDSIRYHQKEWNLLVRILKAADKPAPEEIPD